MCSCIPQRLIHNAGVSKPKLCILKTINNEQLMYANGSNGLSNICKHLKIPFWYAKVIFVNYLLGISLYKLKSIREAIIIQLNDSWTDLWKKDKLKNQKDEHQSVKQRRWNCKKA